MSLRCLPSGFGSIRLLVWDEMSFEKFQAGHHGSHLRYLNRTILALLYLYVAPMPPIVSGQTDLWFGRRYHLKSSRWLQWQPPWILEQNNFSNSESLCQYDASHQDFIITSRLNPTSVWEMSFEEFQDGHLCGHIRYWN